MFVLAVLVALTLGDVESDDVKLKLPEKALNKVEYRRSEVGDFIADVTYAGERYIPADAEVYRRERSRSAYSAPDEAEPDYSAPPGEGYGAPDEAARRRDNYGGGYAGYSAPARRRVSMRVDPASDVSVKLPEKALNKVEYRRQDGDLLADMTYAGDRYIPADANVYRRSYAAPAQDAYGAPGWDDYGYDDYDALDSRRLAASDGENNRRRDVAEAAQPDYGASPEYEGEAARRIGIRTSAEESVDNYGLQIAHDGTDFAGTYQVQFPDRRMMTVSYDMNEAKDGYTAEVYYTDDFETKATEIRRIEGETGTYDARGIDVVYTVDEEVVEDGFEPSLMFDPLLRRSVPFDDLLNTQAEEDGQVFPKEITPSLSRRRMLRRLGRANGRFDMDLSVNF